jgi:NAD(P)-dependent dehydrogenase (short-subunit alcohol dehydrogenase family)
VAVNYCSNTDAADAVVKEIEAAGGVAAAIRADVSRPADVTALFDKAEKKLGGPVTHLVNNAGVIGPRDEGGEHRCRPLFAGLILFGSTLRVG